MNELTSDAKRPLSPKARRVLWLLLRMGIALAIIIFAGLRERIELMDVPKPLKGISIGLITAGILSLAFLGFSGLVKE